LTVEYVNLTSAVFTYKKEKVICTGKIEKKGINSFHTNGEI